MKAEPDHNTIAQLTLFNGRHFEHSEKSAFGISSAEKADSSSFLLGMTWGEGSSMNLLVISGSRNPNGRTASAADALIDGVRSAGGTGEKVFLPHLNVAHCRQCEDSGWGTCKAEGKCVIADDFASIVDKIADADAVAFATPVYYGDLSESLRAFLDRLRRTCEHENGKAKVEGKRAVGICVAGGGGGGGSPYCVFSLERVLSTCGFSVIDMIPARRHNLDMKLEVLKTVGKWLAESR